MLTGRKVYLLVLPHANRQIKFPFRFMLFSRQGFRMNVVDVLGYRSGLTESLAAYLTFEWFVFNMNSFVV